MSKKLNFLIVSFEFLLVGLLLQIKELYLNVFAVFIAITVVLAFVWYKFIKIFGDISIAPKLKFFSLYSASVLLLLFFFPTLDLRVRLAFILFSVVVSYFVMLALNVYIVSDRYGENIPLLQPAKVVAFVAVILTVFYGATIIYKIPVLLSFGIGNFLVKVLVFSVFYYFLFSNIKWFLLSERVGELDEKTSSFAKHLRLFCVYTLVLVSLVLMFYPFEDFGRGVMTGVVTYVLINFFMNCLNRKVELLFYVESFVVILIVYILILLI